MSTVSDAQVHEQCLRALLSACLNVEAATPACTHAVSGMLKDMNKCAAIAVRMSNLLKLQHYACTHAVKGMRMGTSVVQHRAVK